MTPERWQRTEALYHSACARPAAERAAFLAAACPDDDELRNDVESLLNEPEPDDGFLAGPALVVASELVPGGMTGETVGGYCLQNLLGAGGMGEVYRARDAKLGRDVAIKILPRAFTSAPERLARFEREARVLATLNHPNICAIYGLEESDGIRFLILELVNGGTLADALRRSRGAGLPLADVLPIARQIAEALEAAHERGIIHRDLKPANIIVTPDGQVKVLDFGLAKVADPAEAGPYDTVPPGASRAGVMMGTAAYSSPEQACGKVVDRRTDIWSFGCVLYEMVTGRSPFTGETVTDMLASVMKTEPDWTALPDAVRPDLRRLLRRCLEKDPKRRLQSIGDARVQIEDLVSGAAEVAVQVDPPGRLRQRVVPWVVAGALGAVAAWYLKPSPSTPVTQLEWRLPAGQLLDGSGGGHILALSPDGAQIAFVATPLRLYLRSMSGALRAIAGTESFDRIVEPVFSPEGDWIAFYADSSIKKIAIGGGAAVTICPAISPYGMNWGSDGIVVGQGPNGIMRVSPEGGSKPTVIARVQDGELAHGPQVLPGGQHVLFTLATGTAADKWDKAHIVVQSLASEKERYTLDIVGSDARYVPTGHIVYAVGGTVFARTFDLQRLKVTGDPVAVVEGVKRSAANYTGAANVSISGSGSLVYIPGPLAMSSSRLDIALMDTAGKVDPFNLPPGPYRLPRVSPDGKQVAFGIDDGREASVWTYDLSRMKNMQRLTFGKNNRFPTWISSSSVAFQSDREGDLAIFRQSAGGTAQRLTTPKEGESHAPESWSRTTDTLLYSVTKGADVSLWTLSLRDGQARPFTAIASSTPGYATGASFSPDGRRVAYGSAEGGSTNIYVQPFPVTGERYQLPRKRGDGPHGPIWSPLRNELFYNPRLGGFEAVSFTTQPGFAFGNPVPVPRKLQMDAPGSRTSYDITPDGSFVGLISAGRAEYEMGSDHQIQVVLNWFEDLRARLAGR
jgi:Tol biopolymer transport system component